MLFGSSFPMALLPTNQPTDCLTSPQSVVSLLFSLVLMLVFYPKLGRFKLFDCSNISSLLCILHYSYCYISITLQEQSLVCFSCLGVSTKLANEVHTAVFSSVVFGKVQRTRTHVLRKHQYVVLMLVYKSYQPVCCQ